MTRGEQGGKRQGRAGAQTEHREWCGSWQRPEPLVMVAFSTIAGIVLDRFVPLALPAWLALSSAATALWWLLGWFSGNRLRVAILLVGTAAAGGAWHHLSWHLFRKDELGLFAGGDMQPVCLDAVVRTHPACYPAPAPDPLRTRPAAARTELVVRVQRVRDGQDWRVVSGEVALQIAGRRDDLATGDRVRIWGLLQAPPMRRNPGESSWSDGERAQRRLCQVQVQDAAAVRVLALGTRYRPRAWLRQLRVACEEQLDTYLSARQAALAKALLLGTRAGLDRELTNQFFQTGTVHLLAISGLHLGVLVGGFWCLARCLPLSRRTVLLSMLVLVTFYTLLTEAKPPVVRAAVIVSTLCIGRLCGRTPLSFNTLALAGLVIIAIQPTQIFQIGTQLSFLAVAVLLARARHHPGDQADHPLDRLLREHDSIGWRGVRAIGRSLVEVTRASAAVTAISLPLVMGHFHLVSPIGLLVNPIIWAPVSLALFSGLGTILCGGWLPPAAHICGWLCESQLMLIEGCIRAAMRFPGSHLWWIAPPWWWITSFYAGWMAWVYREPRQRVGWFTTCMLLIGIGSGIVLTARSFSPWHESPARSVRCTFISVGHGTSVLLEFPTGQNILYDAGRLGEPSTGVQTISQVLWSRGITQLDAIVISHADADHYNAVPGLLERFRVNEVCVSPQMFDDPSAALDTLHHAIKTAHVPLRTIRAGIRWQLSAETCINVLHPPAGQSSGSDNADSIVLHIRHAGRTLLLPGDLEADGLAQLLAQGPIDYDVVMAPHHGSLLSQPTTFIAWAKPEHVVISGGRNAQVAAVRRDYSAAGAHLWHTAYDGAVTILLQPHAISVTHFERRRQTTTACSSPSIKGMKRTSIATRALQE
jgi:competence protein ComEC